MADRSWRPVCSALLLTALTLTASGCSSPQEPPATTRTAVQKNATFGTAQTLAVGQSARFEDGLTVSLVQIDDSRCRPDVQCVWQGELSPLLHLVGGAIGATKRELRLGTERATSAAMGGYQFALNDALVNSAALTVTKISAQSSRQDDLIRVTTPSADAVVTNPLTVTGEARGPWYFEASFPVKLLDANGKLLVQSHAQAQGEWMTAAFVPFLSTLEFSPPTTPTGTLVLEKDNPSGEPQHDDSRRIPVRFEAGKSPAQ